MDNPECLPVALVPVLSLEDFQRSDGEVADARPTAFIDFDPAQPIANNPGSEALIAHLIGELRRGTLGASIVPAPLTLAAMSSCRARTLVCVTDYIGSGQQVLNYVATWYRNTTIKSWRSYGWLKIVVIAYAATEAGKCAVDTSNHIDQVEVLEITPSVDRLRQSDPSGKAEEVCRVYAKRGRVGPALGHRDSAGLFASSFSVPNNLPAILIRRSRRWVPFFDGRSVTAELADEIGDYRPDPNLSGQLEDAGQSRLAARHSDGHIEPRWRYFISALALLPRSKEDLALSLGLDLTTTQLILETLKQLNLIDGNSMITPAGRQELRLQRRKPRHGSSLLTPNASPYYPGYSR